MPPIALTKSQQVAEAIVSELGGNGLYGVELFIKGDGVYFSEVSPRPHDTGMVTLISQDLSEFALHVRAILNLPIVGITHYGASASAVILPKGTSSQTQFSNLAQALSQPQTQLRLFGKPDITGQRRMGVALARADTSAQAINNAKRAAAAVEVDF